MKKKQLTARQHSGTLKHSKNFSLLHYNERVCNLYGLTFVVKCFQPFFVNERKELHELGTHSSTSTETFKNYLSLVTRRTERMTVATLLDRIALVFDGQNTENDHYAAALTTHPAEKEDGFGIVRPAHFPMKGK